MSSFLSRLHPGRAGSGGGEADLNFALTGDLPRPLDAKAFSKLYKSMDKVVKSLQNPRLSLSRSPPCLIDTLPDIYMKMKDINNANEAVNGEQTEFYYITVNNIYDKCKRVNQLFKEHKDEIFAENSDSRKYLINLTIVIAYIFADLKALFNDNAHFDPNFRIAKEDAEKWWKSTFPGRVIIPWGTFKEQIVASFPTLSKFDLSRLKSTIDLTCNDHVSVFEFDVFTRLFAPWSMLMKNFKKLAFHPGYMASATFENVKTMLSRHRGKPGSYVFRMSCTKLGFWSIGYVTDHHEQRISQIVVRDGKPIVEALMEGAQKGYYLYPNGEPANPDLSDLMHVRPKPQVQVTEAQFEEYSMIGSTFQECKICNTRDKDIQLDLCGHFMCSKCLNQWLSKGTGCPFCRCEIRSTQAIVMQPFQPGRKNSRDKTSGAVAKSETLSSLEEEVHCSLPPPTQPPPALPPGWPLEEGAEEARPETVPATTIASESCDKSPTQSQAVRAAPRRRMPSPERSNSPVQLPPRLAQRLPPDSNSSPSQGLSDSCSINSNDDPDTPYINVGYPTLRNAMPLPEPPRQRTDNPPSSLPLPSTPAASTSAASPHSPAMLSPRSPAVVSPRSPAMASPQSVPTSRTTEEAGPPPTGPPARGPVSSQSVGPRSTEAGADGESRALKSLPPPPPVPLASQAPPVPPGRPRTGSVSSSDGARGRLNSDSSPRAQPLPVPPVRKELRSLPNPPERNDAPGRLNGRRSSAPHTQMNSLPTSPSGAPAFSRLAEPEYNVPNPGSEYNVPIGQTESEYNVPIGQAESEYNVPIGQAESEYNVPIGQMESEYNVPTGQNLNNFPTADDEYNVPRATV